MFHNCYQMLWREWVFYIHLLNHAVLVKRFNWFINRKKIICQFPFCSIYVFCNEEKNMHVSSSCFFVGLLQLCHWLQKNLPAPNTALLYIWWTRILNITDIQKVCTGDQYAQDIHHQEGGPASVLGGHGPPKTTLPSPPHSQKSHGFWW